MLIVWGKNDPIFPAAGAEPYKRDIKNIDFHLLDAGILLWNPTVTRSLA